MSSNNVGFSSFTPLNQMTTPEMVAEWNKELNLLNPSPREILKWTLKKFPTEAVFQSTSFGATGMAIMHMLYEYNSNFTNDGASQRIPVIFIDTLYHFPETLNLAKRAINKYKTKLYTFKPLDCADVNQFELRHGKKLWLKNPDKYDFLVKAEPGHRAFQKLHVRAVFTGRRRSQGADRAKLEFLELDTTLSPPVVKVNPLADWDYDQVWNFLRANHVPYNDLHEKGYKSVGDVHSTAPNPVGEERDGRWAGQDKTECGLHKDYFALKKAAKIVSDALVEPDTPAHSYSNIPDDPTAPVMPAQKTLEIKGAGSLIELVERVSMAHNNSLVNVHSVDFNDKLGYSITISLGAPIDFTMPEMDYYPNNANIEIKSYIATVFSSAPISFAHFETLINLLPNIRKITTVDSVFAGATALEITFQYTNSIQHGELEPLLFAFSLESKIDVAIQEDLVFRRHKRLVIFDMDSTLIQQEVIDELAREADVYDKIAPITEAAMRGEIDFNESLRQRVALLKNQPASIIDIVKARIVFTAGAKDLCKLLKVLGYKLAVLSGGFMPLASYVKDTLGLDYAFANSLEVQDGLLTGQVLGSIVNGEKKAEILKMISQMENIPIEQTIAVGDGANDLLMLAASGLGVAFNAKPKVQERAQVRINQPSLFHLLYLLGLTGKEIEQLTFKSAKS